MILTMHKKIEKAIFTASTSNIESLVEFSDIEHFRRVIRRDYLNTVAFETVDIIAKPKTPTYDVLKKEISRAIRNHPEGLVAGNVFSICYKEMTGKDVPNNIDIYLMNSKQNEIIRRHMKTVTDK